MLPPPQPHAPLQSCNTSVRHRSPGIPSSEPVAGGSPHGRLLSSPVGRFSRGNCSPKGNSSAWLSPSRQLGLPLCLPPLPPLNSPVHRNPRRIQFGAVGTYHLLPPSLSPLTAARWNNPALYIYFGSEWSQGKLSGLAAARNLVQNSRENILMQKALTWLCLVNSLGCLL